jgi:hypothetical protein
MASNIFIKKSLDFILISIESLDPYVLDNLTIKLNINNLIDLFTLKNRNCMRYQEQLFFSNDRKSLIILQQISQIFCKVSIQKNIIRLLQEYTSCNQLPNSSNIEINNYLKRFEINYRKSIRPYLSGKISYNSSRRISDIGLINLFILYRINSSQGTYILLLFLILKNTAIFSYMQKK